MSECRICKELDRMGSDLARCARGHERNAAPDGAPVTLSAEERAAARDAQHEVWDRERRAALAIGRDRVRAAVPAITDDELDDVEKLGEELAELIAQAWQDCWDRADVEFPEDDDRRQRVEDGMAEWVRNA